MAPLFRRGLRCFYCGCWSTQSYKSGLREWLCKSCDAVNYLDATGNITDPPLEAVKSNGDTVVGRLQHGRLSRYAEPVSIFCQTCLNNQSLKARNLADYLPPTNDSRYTEYERRLPEYARKLEERYPQVCETCAPRVNQKLREAGYIAKSNYLRQRLSGTQSARISYASSGWLAPLVYGGYVGWCLGLIGQILWHVLEILVSSPAAAVLMGMHAQPEAFNQLRLWISKNSDVRSRSALASISASIGITCIWWNPSQLYNSPSMTGDAWEFYKLQAIISIVRLSSFYYLRSDQTHRIEEHYLAAIHFILLVFEGFVSVMSFRIGSPRPTSISLRDDFQIETDAKISNRHQREAPTPSHLSSRRTVQPLQKQQNLADVRLMATGLSNVPDMGFLQGRNEDSSLDPSLISGESITRDDDMMEIDPPSPAPRAAPQLQLNSASNTQLPPLCQPQVDSKRDQGGLVQQRSSVPPWRPESSVIKEANTMGQRPAVSHEIDFAPPRFFAPQSETGLESLFSGVFSLDEQPIGFSEAEPTASLPKGRSRRKQQSTLGLTNFDFIPLLLSTIGCVCAFIAKSTILASATLFRSAALQLTALMAAWNTFKALGLGTTVLSLSDVLFYIITGVLGTVFARCWEDCEMHYSLLFVYAMGAVQYVTLLRSYLASGKQDTLGASRTK